jgi:hypothetical protein
MQRSVQKTSRYAHLSRLILVAFCVGVFCAPQTLANSGSRPPLTLLGADAAYDFTGGSDSFENFSRNSSETTSAHTAASSAGPVPVTVSRAPVQASCAPALYSFGGSPVVYWYELLNYEWNTSCTPGWVFQNGYQPITGNPCTIDLIPRSVPLVVFPNAGTFYQDFSVPSDATGPLEVEVWFQTLGGGTHWDRVYVSLWEGNTFRGQYGFPKQTNCGSGRYTFFGNYAGKNLRLKVSDGIVSPGVTHRIEMVRVVSYLP